MDLHDRTIDYRFRDKIPEVREIFKEKIEHLEDPNLVYQQDIDKTMTNDYWVEKFLEWNKGNTIKTADGLVNAAKSIKKHRTRELKKTDLFAEVYSVGTFFKYEPDKFGRTVYYSKGRYSAACKDTRDLSRQLGMYVNLMMEEESGDKGFIVVSDCSGMSMANVDLKLASANMEIMEVFPNSCALFVCVNVPTFLRYIINSLMYLLPEEKRKGVLIIPQEQLPEVIPLENIPDFLGGTCTKPYNGPDMVPEGCVPLREQFKKFVKSKDVDEIIPENDKHNSPLMLQFDTETMLRTVQYYEKLLGISF